MQAVLRLSLPLLLATTLNVNVMHSLALAAEVSQQTSSNASIQALTNEHVGPVVDDAATKLSKAELSQLELLENHFFGRVHPSELVDRRISRLERFVFGTDGGANKDFGERLDKLSGTLAITDPDGKKRVISIAKPAESPPVASNAVDDHAVRAQEQGPSHQVSPATTAGMMGADNSNQASDINTIASASSPDGVNSDRANAEGANGTDDNSAGDNKKFAENFYKTAAVPAGKSPTSLNGRVRTELQRSEAEGVLHLSKSLFPVDGDPTQVMHELSQAIKVHPLDPELMYERAKAFMFLDKIDNALSDLSDAIMNNPNRSLYYLARAWCYKQSGNGVLAKDDIKQAKFVDPALPPRIDFLVPTASADTTSTP